MFMFFLLHVLHCIEFITSPSVIYRMCLYTTVHLVHLTFSPQYLYLGKNPLQVLPKDFGRLDSLLELDLSDCELHSLPDSICHCQALDKLWLNNNK